MNTILVVGDALMGAEQLGGPTRRLLGDRFRIEEASWQIPFEDTVAANLAIERAGPTAVAVEGRWSGEPEADDVVCVVTQFFPLPAEMLARWPRLRVVATLRAGVENIDEDELRRRGIRLVRNLGRNANAVAELTVALMLGRLRSTGENHHSIRSGGWRPEPPAGGYRELSGLSVGLIGLGAVGALVVRRLSGFDVGVRYSDPYASPEQVKATPATRTDIATVMGESDIVSLHARASAETHHLVDAARLDAMRDGAIIVNTARAELIDEAALIERLADGRLAGAALDVFSTEPLPPDHVLRTMPGVQLSPHLAGATVEARSRAPELLAARVAEALGE